MGYGMNIPIMLGTARQGRQSEKAAKEFYRVEEHHQKYLGGNGFCHMMGE